jgi:hypothetical protein
MLSLRKLSDLGTSWVFGSKVKGYHPQPDPPTHHQDTCKNFFTIYKQTQFVGLWDILEKHMQHGLANWFLAVASGLPSYLKGRRENTKPTSSQWNCNRHGGLRDAGHEVGK